MAGVHEALVFGGVHEDDESEPGGRVESERESNASGGPAGSVFSDASGESKTSDESSWGSALEKAMALPPVAGPEPAAVRVEQVRLGGMAESTDFWKSFKFTEVKKSSAENQVVGIEATCNIAGHRLAGQPACTRTFRFARHGGRASTLHRLKWWCIEGFHPERWPRGCTAPPK